MKKVFSKKFLGIPMAVIAIVLVAAVALAAWGLTDLTSTGLIHITETPSESYNVTSTILAFGETYVESGQPISVTSAVITVVNDGSVTINGIDFVVDLNYHEFITDSSYEILGCPIAPLGTATVTVTLTGPALYYPCAPVDLSGITAILTPN